jgi:hypothetical protein
MQTPKQITSFKIGCWDEKSRINPDRVNKTSRGAPDPARPAAGDRPHITQLRVVRQLGEIADDAQVAHQDAVPVRHPGPIALWCHQLGSGHHQLGPAHLRHHRRGRCNRYGPLNVERAPRFMRRSQHLHGCDKSYRDDANDPECSPISGACRFDWLAITGIKMRFG